MPPTPERTTCTATSLCGSLAISSSKASSEPDTSALSTRLSSETTPPRAWSKIVSSDLLAGAAGLLLELEPVRARLHERPRRAVVLDDADELARLGDRVEAEHLDRHRRAGLLDAGAVEVVHRAHAAPVGADERVADLQRAALDEHRTTAPRPGSSLDSMTWPEAVGVRVGLELLDLGHQQDRLDQVVEVLLGLGRDVDEHRLAAPLLRLEAEVGHLGADAVGLRALLVDLVDRDEHRHLGRLRVVDRLARLRHHAVVGGDDDHGDVGDLLAAGAHGGERLVARRVEEGDGLPSWCTW